MTWFRSTLVNTVVLALVKADAAAAMALFTARENKIRRTLFSGREDNKPGANKVKPFWAEAAGARLGTAPCMAAASALRSLVVAITVLMFWGTFRTLSITCRTCQYSIIFLLVIFLTYPKVQILIRSISLHSNIGTRVLDVNGSIRKFVQDKDLGLISGYRRNTQSKASFSSMITLRKVMTTYAARPSEHRKGWYG
jgi:hypothetical protein